MFADFDRRNVAIDDELTKIIVPRSDQIQMQERICDTWRRIA